MPEEETPVVEVTPEVTESEPSNFEESAAAAEESLLENAGDEPTPQVTSTEETPPVEGEVETKVEDTDPEHIAWAKSINGHFDPEKGFDSERITKQAFELNKQNQSQAANLKQLKEAFQHPEIAEVFRKVYLNGAPAATPEATVKPDSEKTNEEILTDFVDKRYEAKVGDLAKQNNFVYQQQLQREYKSVSDTLHTEFTDYDKIKESVNNAVAQAAADAGITQDALLEFLATNGKLLDTYRSAARNILFPALQEKVTTTEKVEVQVQESLDKQKRAALPGKGTPSSQVEVGEKGKMTFEESMEAAEEELKTVAS